MRPRVSVITIFRDAERFLAEAVESVLAQSYARWELLLVDDGSADAGAALARGYAERQPDRIRYLTHPGRANRGMSASRNLGLRHATGEYIALLDADDVYLPTRLEHQVRLLDARPRAGFVYGATLYWYGWTGRPADRARDRVRSRGIPPGELVRPPGLVPLLLRDLARTPCTCGVLMRRAAVERVGGFEERFHGMFEDQAFFYKLCLDVPVYVDDACLDRYRQHEDSWCARMEAAGRWRRDGRPNEARRAFLEWLELYLRARDVTDPALWTALRRELRPYRRPLPAPLRTALAPVRRLRRHWTRRRRRLRGRPTRPDSPPAAASTISVCIVCRDEADRLGPCLESVEWADELVVMDLSSGDGSAALAERHGAHVISRDPVPIVERVRDEVAAAADGAWVLVIDPDERVTPGLAGELRRLARRTDIDAVVVPRMNYDLGYPPGNPRERYEPQLRMYRRRRVDWPTAPNALPDVPAARTHRIEPRDDRVLVHDRNRTIPEALDRVLRYAPAQARSMADRGEVFSARAMLRDLGTRAYRQFIQGRAWRDGVPGILRAGILVGCHFYVWAAFWQVSGAERTPRDDRLLRRIGVLLEPARALLALGHAFLRRVRASGRAAPAAVHGLRTVGGALIDRARALPLLRRLR